jgi:type III pantothenate kinase
MLCLDIGNTQIYAGYYNGSKVSHNFRITTKLSWSSDQFGVFIRSCLREQGIDYQKIKKVAICSVVPSVNYSIRSAFIKYFSIEPFFLQLGVKTGLIVNKYKNPHEIGSDIIAGCVAGIDLFPNKNIIIADLGTATTIAAVNYNKEFCGGVILPGIKTQADSLSLVAEKLSAINIIAPPTVTGLSTNHAIQSGIYYSHLAAIKSLAERMALENFAEGSKDTKIIGTGGFATLYSQAKIFDTLEPDLIIKGLILIEKLNNG